MAMPKPEAMATQLVAGAAAVVPCAYAGMVIILMASSANITIITFRIVCLLRNRCQWVVGAHRADALTLAANCLVLVRHRFAEVHRRQQHKNVGLDKRDANVQQHENDGKDNGEQRKEHECHHVARKHIGEKTNGERKNSSQMACYLNYEHQGSEPPYRAQEMLDITDSVGANTMHLVINPRHHGTSERYRWNRCRRFKSRDQANQVTGQDEQSERDQVVREPGMAMADDLVALFVDHPVDALKYVLQR